MRQIADALWVIAFATSVMLGLLLAVSILGAFTLTALLDLNLVSVDHIPHSLLNFNIISVTILLAAYIFIRHAKKTTVVTFS